MTPSAYYSRKAPSGIRVIIVGAGFAGITAAIECDRKGHSVLLLESFPELKILGDVISFGANAGRIFQRWPGVVDELDPIIHKSNGIHFKSYLGEDLFTQWWNDEPSYGTHYNGHRGEIHEIIFNYAKRQGIEIMLGQKIVDYFEDDSTAGVVLDDGRKISGDVVLAADGLKSLGRKIVLGYEDKPKPSGYAVYRSWFDSAELAKNPLTSYLVNDGDKHAGWLGPDVHFLAASIKDGKDFSWVCTHKDDADIEESWQTPGKVEDVLKVLEGWDPVCHDIVKATPPEYLVDWKLVYRDPLPTWTSPKSRTLLIGDAAHPFLPTSIQGASQAMEDGASVAVCLELAGKQNVQQALRVHQQTRYNRVVEAQKTGVATRDRWHKADFENIKKNPQVLKLKREEWLLNHDAEIHAYKVYEETANKLHEKLSGNYPNRL